MGKQKRISNFYAQAPSALWINNLLEDIALVNRVNQRDNGFPALYISITRLKNGLASDEYLFSSEIQDFGICCLLPSLSALQATENSIPPFSGSISSPEYGVWHNRANHDREIAQEVVEKRFWESLFHGHKFSTRGFFIESPHKHYVASGGNSDYMLDRDLWKIQGDNAVFTRNLYFEVKWRDIVFRATEQRAKELFPHAQIERSSTVCLIRQIFF